MKIETKPRWLKVPEKTELEWLGQWLFASMMMRALTLKKRLPTWIRIDSEVKEKTSDCACDCHKGDGMLEFDLSWAKKQPK